jgi:hypothetical protein
MNRSVALIHFDVGKCAKYDAAVTKFISGKDWQG